MQFSDTTNKTGIVEDITFLTGFDTNSYALADRTRNANRWYYKAVMAAWRASSDWEFDDANQSNMPIATTTLVADQKDYTIPTNALRILRVEVKDSAGNWVLVQPFDETQIGVALDEFEKTSGVPRYYRLTRRSVIMHPAPSAAAMTLTAGLKIYFLREVDEFTVADTTQEPGIAEPFHRVISLGASYDFALAKGLQNTAVLKQEVEQLLAELGQFYSARHRNFKAQLRVRKENYT